MTRSMVQKSRGCLVPGVKNFKVSHQMFHRMSEEVFGY
jgi:hypothetical protein